MLIKQHCEQLRFVLCITISRLILTFEECQDVFTPRDMRNIPYGHKEGLERGAGKEVPLKVAREIT